MRICVVGLGNMGGSVAARLAETGHNVVGHDPAPEARDAAARQGVRPAGTLPEGVADAEVIITSLPGPAAVRSVWLGEGGLAALAGPGTFAIELSTIDPGTMREVAAAAGAAGVRVLDCPVSGGPAEARQGTLSLIVGGEDRDVEALRGVLEDMGASVSTTGDVGTAKAVKLVNNMMSMGNVLVAAEAFAVGVRAGVDPQRLYEVLSVSGGRSHHFTKRFPKALEGDFRPGFTMRLGEKDLTLALELARSVGLPAPAAAVARDIMGIAAAEGYADSDIVALLDLYARWAH